MKKSGIWAIIFVLLIGIIAGCSSEQSTGTSKDGTVTLKYFAFSPGEDHEDELKAMIAAFEKKNPKIKVDYELASFDDYFTKLQTQIAGNNAPDVFELNYENFVSYASKGALLELDPLIEKDTNFNPDSINKKAYEAFQYDGKQYGMVESFSNVVLFYNKDLFDKAGVEYPNDSWTWKEELAAAEKLTDKKNGVWGTYSPVQFWEFYKTIAQNGGSILNEDKTEVTVNSPENVETLTWMMDKMNKYHVTPTEKEMSGQANEDLFKAGKIAMLRTGIWMFDGFKDVPFKWDIALEPGNTQKAHHFFANGLAVSKKTKNAEAAWKWAQFMSSSEEAAKIRIDSAWELPAVSNDALVKGYLEKSPPESRDVVFKALDTLVVPPVIEEWSKMTDMFGKELDKVKLGQATPEEALKNVEKELNTLIKK
ncbi:ABC transporter substrate-binding protein [Fictibacillus halophilus]|uniref:ABC transporter substrate-binding protein n=1 Tax=Fictibacillus TaxID=1329200 RepID=UPI00203F9E6A|nr:sugar ABC transporter substrate-binding protein [Fictibacillus nanhaiensis]MCM3731145.1 sugar ABC transporter substrate-binding protein [Fictibacillus nanhaiensis]